MSPVTDIDSLFQTVGDPSRRALVDRIARTDGISVVDLTKARPSHPPHHVPTAPSADAATRVAIGISCQVVRKAPATVLRKAAI